MDFSLSWEQCELRDVAQAFLESCFPVHRFTGTADGGSDRQLWSRIVDMGWLSPDLDPVSLAVLAELGGYHLLSAPWWATMGLAGPARDVGGTTSTSPATLAWAESGITTIAQSLVQTRCRAEPDGDGYRLFGLKTTVPDLDVVDHAVVLARTPDGLVLLSVDLVTDPSIVVPLSTLDETRSLAHLRLEATPARLLVGPQQTHQIVAETGLRAMALLAAEAVGVASRALDFATEHARSRTQFGRPIGAFQAVAHPLVDVLAAVEVARSLVLRAAWCLTSDDRAAATDAVTIATIASRRAALAATERAIQTLGGMGFTWEHPAHRWYKRARWLHSYSGTPRVHRAALASTLIDG